MGIGLGLTDVGVWKMIREVGRKGIKISRTIFSQRSMSAMWAKKITGKI